MRVNTSLLNKLEESIQKRNKYSFLNLIKRNKAKIWIDSTLFKHVCEGYRRLSLFKQGLTFCDFKNISDTNIYSTRDIRGIRVFWSARFLSLLGYKNYALHLTSLFKENSLDEKKIISDILFANGQYKSALSNYEAILDEYKIKSNQLSVNQNILIKITIGDLKTYLGKFNDAHKTFNHVFEELKVAILDPQNSKLLIGICHQARAELYCHENKFNEALEEILKAKEYIISNEISLDSFFHYKWLGYVYHKLNQFKKSKSTFAIAEKILFKLTVRPEVKLDYLRIKSVCNNDFYQLLKLLNYPGLIEYTNLLIKSNIDETQNNIHTKIEDQAKIRSLDLDYYHKSLFKVPKPKYTIFIHSQEYYDHNQEKQCWFLTKELELIGWIILAGEIGLPLSRASELLWPNEFYSYFEIEKRLKSLIFRIRKLGKFKLLLKNNILTIKNNKNISVDVVTKHPLFLETKKEFCSSEIDHFYKIKSRTIRSKIISMWIEKNLIKFKEKKQKGEFVYSVNLP